MDSGGTVGSPSGQINLQTLVSSIQNAVQAQNLIATNISKLTAAFNTAFPAPLTGSAVWDPPNLASGASTTTTITVAGAAVGNFVQLSFGLDLQGLSLVGYVSSANTVTAVLSNLTGGAINLASSTLKARVTVT